MENLIAEIYEIATRKNRASNLKSYLTADLDLIAKRCEAHRIAKGSEMPVVKSAPAEPHAAASDATLPSASVGESPAKTNRQIGIEEVKRRQVARHKEQTRQETLEQVRPQMTQMTQISAQAPATENPGLKSAQSAQSAGNNCAENL